MLRFWRILSTAQLITGWLFALTFMEISSFNEAFGWTAVYFLLRDPEWLGISKDELR